MEIKTRKGKDMDLENKQLWDIQNRDNRNTLESITGINKMLKMILDKMNIMDNKIYMLESPNIQKITDQRKEIKKWVIQK